MREDRDWYAAAALEHGWSRAVLEHQIMNQLRTRSGAAASNFGQQLATPDGELAQGLPKDPYVFDFLDLRQPVAERDLEQALLTSIVETLRELGDGFAFVDRQKHLEVDGRDFYVDLLFFHTTQLRYVVIELKTGDFDPAFAGQLGFYVAAVDHQLRQPAHRPTIGILLCTNTRETIVRYTLGSTSQPLAVATYTFDGLPADAKATLPNAERLTHALEALRLRQQQS